MDTDTTAQERPIGWWLERVDAQLDAVSSGLLEAEAGVGRRHWQVLNVVAHGAADLGVIEAALADVDDGGLGTVVDDLAARGWCAMEGTGSWS